MQATYTHKARAWTLNAERSGSIHNHWSVTRSLTKDWRTAFWALGSQQRHRFNKAHVVVTIVMKPPLADTGNHYTAVKAAIDGLVDARVLPDDTPQSVLSLTMLAPRKTQKGAPETFALTLIADDEDSLCALCHQSIPSAQKAHDHTQDIRKAVPK
jgi:hypothetical protein